MQRMYFMQLFYLVIRCTQSIRKPPSESATGHEQKNKLALVECNQGFVPSIQLISCESATAGNEQRRQKRIPTLD